MSFAAKRHQKILELLDKSGEINAIELTDALNTSRETVRRDLNELSDKGLLIKTHGGAVSLERKIDFEIFTPLNNRKNAHQTEKQALCRYAAKLVEEYDTIYIDNSTTAAHIIDYIPKQYKLTFITNSINLITELSVLHNPKWNIIALGGVLDYETYSVNRYLAMNNLKYFQPNKSFISCHGVGEEFIVADTNIDDVEIKRYIVNTCKQTFLLVDYSKMPCRGVVNIADASEFHCIITNDKVNSAFLCQLVSHNCTVRLVPNKQNN
jgi:DeoR/GlpR family transcriptional regulator of sugar metabolism